MPTVEQGGSIARGRGKEGQGGGVDNECPETRNGSRQNRDPAGDFYDLILGT